MALCTNGGKRVRVEMPRRPEPNPAAEPVDASRFIGDYAREGVTMVVREGADGTLRLQVHNTSPLAASLPDPPEMQLLPFDGDVLLAKGPDDEAFTAAVFDLDGERYLHMGARASRRVG